VTSSTPALQPIRGRLNALELGPRVRATRVLYSILMRRFSTLPIFFVYAAAACQTKGAPVGGVPDAATVDGAAPRPSVDSGCRVYAAAMCDAFERCEAGRLAANFGGLQECKDQLFEECALPAQLPGSAVSNESLARCAASVKDKACPVSRAADECEEPKGTLKIGAVCSSNMQCESKNCGPTKIGCGVCAAPLPPRPTHKAQRSGERCDESVICGWHLACVDHHCVELRKQGFTCNASDDSCDVGLTCIAGKCAPAKVRKLGEACTSTLLGLAGGPTPCGPGLRCDRPLSKAEGTCVALVGEGDGCKRSGGPRCRFPFECVADHCLTPVQRYTACTTPPSR